jgi:hypothetical protein
MFLHLFLKNGKDLTPICRNNFPPHLSHFQNYGNEFNDALQNRFLLNWQNKKIP